MLSPMPGTEDTQVNQSDPDPSIHFLIVGCTLKTQTMYNARLSWLLRQTYPAFGKGKNIFYLTSITD